MSPLNKELFPPEWPARIENWYLEEFVKETLGVELYGKELPQALLLIAEAVHVLKERQRESLGI
jgi:hypothetical protein